MDDHALVGEYPDGVELWQGFTGEVPRVGDNVMMERAIYDDEEKVVDHVFVEVVVLRVDWLVFSLPPSVPSRSQARVHVAVLSERRKDGYER